MLCVWISAKCVPFPHFSDFRGHCQASSFATHRPCIQHCMMMKGRAHISAFRNWFTARNLLKPIDCKLEVTNTSGENCDGNRQKPPHEIWAEFVMGLANTIRQRSFFPSLLFYHQFLTWFTDVEHACSCTPWSYSANDSAKETKWRLLPITN